MANSGWRSLLGTTQHVTSSIGQYRPAHPLRRQPRMTCTACNVTIFATDVQAHARAAGHAVNPLIEYRVVETATGRAYVVAGVGYKSPRVIRRVFRTGRLRQVA